MSTIKDVAAHAGVSYSTVSHVLNGTRPVSEEARDRVLQAVQLLGYLPSAVARSLKTSETHILGVLVPNITNPFFAELTRGIEDRCHQAGYSVFLCNSDDDTKRQALYHKTLLERRVDGLLLASTGGVDSVPHGWASYGVPCVIVDRPVPGLKADWVRVDNEAGARIAVEHLLALGHRAIGCIGGPSDVDVSRARAQGWYQALKAARVKAHENWLVEGDFTCESGYVAARTLLAHRAANGNMTAIFASNDLMAMGALRAAAECGISVPKQMSVIGFDGIELGGYVHPGLSTVCYPIRGLGEQAAQVLLERIAQPRKAVRELSFTPKLLLRESTAAPQN